MGGQNNGILGDRKGPQQPRNAVCVERGAGPRRAVQVRAPALPVCRIRAVFLTPFGLCIPPHRLSGCTDTLHGKVHGCSFDMLPLEPQKMCGRHDIMLHGCNCCTSCDEQTPPCEHSISYLARPRRTCLTHTHCVFALYDVRTGAADAHNSGGDCSIGCVILNFATRNKLRVGDIVQVEHRQ